MEEGGDTGLLKRYSLVWHGGIVIRLMGLGVSVSSMNIFNIVDRSREHQEKGIELMAFFAISPCEKAKSQKS